MLILWDHYYLSSYLIGLLSRESTIKLVGLELIIHRTINNSSIANLPVPLLPYLFYKCDNVLPTV